MCSMKVLREKDDSSMLENFLQVDIEANSLEKHRSSMLENF